MKMKTWTISLKINDETLNDIELVDMNEIVEGYLNINRNFFDELLQIAKVLKKYAIGKGIENIIGPDKKNWTNNPWVLFMAKDNEKETPFWLLLKREKDLTGNLVGIGPQRFFDYLKSTKEPDDEIKRFIEYIIAYPQKFKLSMIIPNFIN